MYSMLYVRPTHHTYNIKVLFINISLLINLFIRMYLQEVVNLRLYRSLDELNAFKTDAI